MVNSADDAPEDRQPRISLLPGDRHSRLRQRQTRHRGLRDVADNLTAHVDVDGDVVFVTLEHAAEVLAPYLRALVSDRDNR